MSKELKKASTKFIAPIDEAELICRMIEAYIKLKRLPGATAQDALKALPTEDVEPWRRAARAAMDYWRECIQEANRVN